MSTNEANTALTQTDNIFRLLDLPLVARARIFEYVLKYSTIAIHPPKTCDHVNHKCYLEKEDRNDIPPLLLVNKQISWESKPLLSHAHCFIPLREHIQEQVYEIAADLRSSMRSISAEWTTCVALAALPPSVRSWSLFPRLEKIRVFCDLYYNGTDYYGERTARLLLSRKWTFSLELVISEWNSPRWRTDNWPDFMFIVIDEDQYVNVYGCGDEDEPKTRVMLVQDLGLKEDRIAVHGYQVDVYKEMHTSGEGQEEYLELQALAAGSTAR